MKTNLASHVGLAAGVCGLTGAWIVLSAILAVQPLSHYLAPPAGHTFADRALTEPVPPSPPRPSTGTGVPIGPSAAAGRDADVPRP